MKEDDKDTVPPIKPSKSSSTELVVPKPNGDHGMFKLIITDPEPESAAVAAGEELEALWKSVVTLFSPPRKSAPVLPPPKPVPLEDSLPHNVAVALHFFSSLAEKSSHVQESKLLSGSIKLNDVFKVYQHVFQTLVAAIMALLRGQHKAKSGGGNLRALVESHKRMNEALVILLHGDSRGVVIQQQDKELLIQIFENVKALQELVAQIHGRDLPFPEDVCLFKYYQLQAMAVIASYNGEKKFMIVAATDLISTACNMYERCLNFSFMSECSTELYSRQIVAKEKWVTHRTEKYKLISSCVRRKNFAVIHVPPAPDGVPFTLLYVNLYYEYNVCKSMIERKALHNEQRLLETVVSIFKAIALRLRSLLPDPAAKDKDIPQVLCVLNEIMICSKLLVALLLRHEDPLQVMVDYDLQQVFRQTACDFVGVSLYRKYTGSLDLELENYASAGHFCSKMFRLLEKLQRFSLRRTELGPSPNGSPRGSPALGLYCNDLVLDLLGFVESRFDIFPGAEPLLRAHLMDYAISVSSTNLLKLVMRLLDHKLFALTAPTAVSKDSVAGYTLEIDRMSERKIVQLLNRAMAFDKEWAQYVYEYLWGQIAKSLSQPERLFGLLKIVYCTARNEVLDNSGFHTIAIMGKEDAGNLLISCNEKTAAAFSDTRILVSLAELLIDAYCVAAGKSRPLGAVKKPEIRSEIVILMLENVVSALCVTPVLCEQLLAVPDNFSTAMELCFVYPASRAFFLRVFRCALEAFVRAKRAKWEDCNKNNYLPLIIIDKFASRFGDKPEPGLVPLFIQFCSLLTGFLSIAPPIHHQSVLARNSAVEQLYRLRCVVAPATTEEGQAGELMCMFLAFLRGVMFRNRENKERIAVSSVVAPDGLPAALRDIIKRV